jgi:hypothetical protein
MLARFLYGREPVGSVDGRATPFRVLGRCADIGPTRESRRLQPARHDQPSLAAPAGTRTYGQSPPTYRFSRTTVSITSRPLAPSGPPSAHAPSPPPGAHSGSRRWTAEMRISAFLVHAKTATATLRDRLTPGCSDPICPTPGNRCVWDRRGTQVHNGGSCKRPPSVHLHVSAIPDSS